MGALVSSAQPVNALWFAFGTFGVAAVAALCVGTDYRRLRLDRGEKVAAQEPATSSTSALAINS
jgi:hypothetical protein